MNPRQSMPQQDPRERVKNFNEVCLGYSIDAAKLEAARCIFCPKPLCVTGCPVGIDIPGFIKFIKEGDFSKAAEVIKKTNPLPAVCGRVCPQEKQCEKVCIVGKKQQPVAIGNLERFVGDWELTQSTRAPAHGIAHNTLSQIAIVGSGPAGLAAASELINLGYGVTIFEALHKPGGVLVFGIPNFRLPKEIVAKEIEALKNKGILIQTNVLVGKSVTLDELFQEGFKAVFIATGAGLPIFMDIPGENLNGVYSANEFLTRVNLMKAYLFPDYATPVIVGKNVVVVGGGDTALDAARTAMRFQPESVTIVYRRSVAEMPARKEEIEHAKEEGIKFQFLANPIRLLSNESAWVKRLECIRMELGEPDEQARRRPIPVKDSEFLLDADTVIIAIGNEPHPLLVRTTPGLVATQQGTLVVNKSTMMTSKEGIFAGGDIISGGATVIEAMGQGKKAAMEIDKYLKSL